MNIKNNKQQSSNSNIKLQSIKRRAENKDELDSREGEEQIVKRTQITHNRREKQSERKKVKN